jgi:putative transposase
MTNAPLGGNRWARTLPIVGSSGPSGASSPTAAACRSASPCVEGANRHDFKMARETLTSLPIERPEPTDDRPQGMWLDKGDDADEVRDLLIEFRFTPHIRARGEEAQALKQEAGFRARRWVVERTHSWMIRVRRVLIRWDKTVRHSLAFLHLACAYITSRQIGLLG